MALNRQRREEQEQVRQAERELNLFARTLDGINPQLGSLAKGILNIKSSIGILTNPSSGALSVLSAGLTVAGTLWKGVNTLFGESNRITEERIQLYAKQRQEAMRLAEALRDSIDATGNFANSLSGFDSSQLINEFHGRMRILERGIGAVFGVDSRNATGTDICFTSRD